MIDHDQAKDILFGYTGDDQRRTNQVQASQDPNWLQTVGHVGQALNLLGISGVSIQREAPPSGDQAMTAEAAPQEGISPLIWVLGGGVVVLIVALLVLNKD
jgi:hypothetical protein